MEKNKIMPFAATWMNLEILIPSEVNEPEKDKHHMILNHEMISLMWNIKKEKYR